MDAIVETVARWLFTELPKLGPIGAIVSAAIVGLTLAVIVFAKSKDLWAESRGRTQGIEFQDKLLAAIDRLMASEQAALKRIEDLSRENGAMRDEVDELRASLALLRNQRRKLIEIARDIKVGKAGKAGLVQ